MRTALDPDKRLVVQARVLAAGQGTHLTRLIEESLALRPRPAPKTAQAKRVALAVQRVRLARGSRRQLKRCCRMSSC
jgi:hypothetical protein